MPYIEDKARHELDTDIVTMPRTPGELCYVLTKQIVQGVRLSTPDMIEFIDRYMAANVIKPSWTNYCSIIGAMGGTVFEFERRGYGKQYVEQLQHLSDVLKIFYMIRVGPYEDRKRDENGDVFL